MALNVNAEANIRRWPECPLTIYYVLDPAQVKARCMSTMCTGQCVHSTVCALCSMCPVHCALHVHTLDTKMCAPSGKFVLACSSLCRIFFSVVHSRNPGKLSIKNILSPRTNMLLLTALSAEENVWVIGILHFDLMINISCLVNGHVLILVIIHKTSPFD